MPARRLLSPVQRKSYTVCIFLVILLILGFAAAIPFFWESKSLWYKTGSDKLLLQLGKIFGLIAAVLFFYQIVLVQRLVIFDRIFGLDHLYSFHRINSFLILGMDMLHAALVVFPEGLDNRPIGWKFLPELLGALLFIMLGSFITITIFRRKLLSYQLWRKIHRPAGYLLVGEDIVAIRVTVPSSFTYAPGQFAFLNLRPGKNDAGDTPGPAAKAIRPKVNFLGAIFSLNCNFRLLVWFPFFARNACFFPDETIL